MTADKRSILANYRLLIKLIKRLPAAQRVSSLEEARSTCRARVSCTDPEQRLSHLKELASKIGYLRVVTPRLPGDSAREAGRFVLRDGQLIEGEGETMGSRVATGVLSTGEAMQRNNKHFKRFYGADKPANMFF